MRLGICDLRVLAVEDDFGLFEVAAGVCGVVRPGISLVGRGEGGGGGWEGKRTFVDEDETEVVAG